MRVFGVDLAWSETNRTGLCAVAGAAVLGSTSCRSLAEAAAWIRRHSAGEMLVAIDAPIVVINRDGRRGCEQVLAGAYGREHAGPHSANASRPWLQGPTRAQRLSSELRLGWDPAHTRSRPLRVALEVYPHPALVSLFHLPARIPYKAAKSRRREARRPGFELLVECLYRLRAIDPPLDVTTSPRWEPLLAELAAARTDVELDRVEDELDAHVCAYVGLYHLAWAGTRSLTVGDVEHGYIVTPVDERHADLIHREAARCGVPVS